MADKWRINPTACRFEVQYGSRGAAARTGGQLYSAGQKP